MAGHKSTDRTCKAVGKKCNYCGVLEHFAKSKFCKRGKTPIPARGKGRARRGGQTQHHLSDQPTDTDEAKTVAEVGTME